MFSYPTVIVRTLPLGSEGPGGPSPFSPFCPLGPFGPGSPVLFPLKWIEHYTYFYKKNALTFL